MQVLGCPKTPASKPYISSLLKVLAGLPLGGCSQEAVKRLRSLAGAWAALLCLLVQYPCHSCGEWGACACKVCRSQEGHKGLQGLASNKNAAAVHVRTGCLLGKQPLTCIGCVLIAPAPVHAEQRPARRALQVHIGLLAA